MPSFQKHILAWARSQHALFPLKAPAKINTTLRMCSHNTATTATQLQNAHGTLTAAPCSSTLQQPSSKAQTAL